MNWLILLLLVSCDTVTQSGGGGLFLEMPDLKNNQEVGSTIDIPIKVPDSRDGMPGDPKIRLLIICDGTEVYSDEQQPSSGSAEFDNIKITDKFRGQCVVSAYWQHGFDSLHGSTKFTVGKSLDNATATDCVDLSDLKIYLGKQFNICDKALIGGDDIKLQCGDNAKAIDLSSDLGLPQKIYFHREGDDLDIRKVDTVVVVAKDSVPNNCKVTIHNKSFTIAKPPASGADKNIAKNMVTSVTTENDRIKIDLRAELADNTGLFISVADRAWQKITSGGLTDFSSYLVNTVEILVYEKSAKGIWWDYLQKDLP